MNDFSAVADLAIGPGGGATALPSPLDPLLSQKCRLFTPSMALIYTINGAYSELKSLDCTNCCTHEGLLSSPTFYLAPVYCMYMYIHAHGRHNARLLY